MGDNIFLNFDQQQKIFLNSVAKLPIADQRKINKGFQLAKEAHSDQTRDEGVPYAIHVIRMASYLLNELSQKDPSVIIAALLHDTLEDTKLKIERIEQEFGSETTGLIKSLTRERPPDETEEQKRVNKVNHFKKTLAEDYTVRLVKAVDLLDNLRSITTIPKSHPSQKKLPRWIDEAKEYYIPLAKTVDRKIVQHMRQALNKVESIKED